jgi:hypothetical protein
MAAWAQNVASAEGSICHPVWLFVRFVWFARETQVVEFADIISPSRDITMLHRSWNHEHAPLF